MPDHFTQFPFAKRAARACLYCRARKSRCNVEKQGQPCSNCLSDEVDCQIAESKRGRKPRQRVKTNPNCVKTKHHEPQDAGPINSNVDGSRPTVPLCRLSPTHTTGWLDDDDVEMEMFAQCHDKGMYICSSLNAARECRQ